VQRDGEVGRDGRLAHSALAARHRDQPPGAALAGHQHAHRVDPRQGGSGGADIGFELCARGFAEPGHVEHDAGAGPFETGSGTAGGDGFERGRKGFIVGHRVPDRRTIAARHCKSARTPL